MSNNKLTLNGLDELRTALRQLPEELTRQAAAIVVEHAQAAERDIEAGYPIGPTGNLRSRVTLETNFARVSAVGIVRSRAPHAMIFERGTARRQTDKGYNRGRMPPAPLSAQMIPKAIRARRRMINALIELVREAGFEVDA